MSNYIRSEIYRIIRGKGIYIFPSILIGLVVLMNIVLWVYGREDITFRYNTTKFAFSNLYGYMQFMIVLCICMVSIVFGQENRDKTLKNTIAFGISRKTIYFGKVVVSLLYGILVMTMVIASFVGTAYLLLEDSGVEQINLLIGGLVTAIPILIFCTILGVALYIVIEREDYVYALWFFIVMVLPQMFMKIGMKSEICSKIASYMPFNMLGDVVWEETAILGWSTQEGIGKVIISSLIGIILACLIGIYGFKNKEIK